MTNIELPKWIFEKGIGQYFLIAIKPDGKASVDGGHSDIEGVIEAKKLYQSLTVLNIPKDTEYYMIKIDEVPNNNVEVNEEAIEVLNSLKK